MNAYGLEGVQLDGREVLTREQMHVGTEPVRSVNSCEASLVKPASTGRTIRTLVAEPLPRMLKHLAQVLTHEGNFALVATATDGCQALRYALALSPELVVMDFHLPQLDGIQVTRQLKQLENPPIVILLASDPSVNSQAKAAGADAFVVKAKDMRVQLRARLRDFFGSRGEGQNPTGVCPVDCLAQEPVGWRLHG